MIGTAIPLSAALGLEPLSDKDNTFMPGDVEKAKREVQTTLGDLPGLSRAQVAGGVVEALVGALRTPLTDVAVGAWNKRKEIRKYADPKAYPPDQTNEVLLTEHSVVQTLKPKVEVRMAGATVVTVPFKASVKLTLKGAGLVIRAGTITHVRLGDVTLKAELKSGEVELLKKESRKLALNARIRLGDGVRIPPPDNGVPGGSG